MKNLDFLTFSFDTLKNDAGDDQFKKNASEKLELIRKYSKKYNINASAIITITSKNTDEIEGIIKRLDNHGISVLLSLIHSGKGRFDFRRHVPELEFRTDEEMKRLDDLQEALLRMKKQGYKISEKDDFIRNMKNFVQGRYRMDCPAADQFFTIDIDGRIKACHDTPASEVNALDFDDYDKMRKDVKKTIIEGCNCYYDCYYNSQFGNINLINILNSKR